MNSWLKGSDDRQTTPVLNQDGQHGKSSDDSRNESVFANTYDSEDRQVNELTNPSPLQSDIESYEPISDLSPNNHSFIASAPAIEEPIINPTGFKLDTNETS